MANDFYAQKIKDGNKTQVTYEYNSYRSMTFTNTHSAAVSVTLYVTSQLTTDITNTAVKCNDTDGIATPNSVTLTVDTTTATADALLDERVYKSDGTLFGVCTAINSGTEIVFSGGLVNAIANNDNLYTGTRYTMLNAVVIPANTALKLEPSDFEFDWQSYNMYIDSSNASGYIDIITRF